MTGMVGSVTRQRYDELVRLGRDWVETMSGVQWQLGDAGLEIEPMRSYGGANPSGSEELFTVSEAIRMFAEDRRPGVFDGPGLPVGGLALAEGTPADGSLPHHPQDPRLPP
ncbi:hypothetical protein [Streptomyces sp. NPDC056683]|uniref:hypothetical protein n=1 Tax=Streptomyces sp. NPDC056683 TaxID=3345910 RepID=UPI0036B35B70